MNPRIALDLAVKRITGKDIRLVGNWEPVPGLPFHSCELAVELDMREQDLLRCRDISDVLNLLEVEKRELPPDPGEESLF